MRFLTAALFLLSSWTATLAAAQEKTNTAEAIFAGGCFWCMETPFDKLEGVVSTTSGYTGGTVDHPTYKQVSEGGTGHLEVVKVVFDPTKVSYTDLLAIYWRNVDPLDGGGQFCDRGEQYQSAIFAGDEDQRRQAERTKRIVTEVLGKPVETTIRTATPFWPAEDYHQDYAKKNPFQYWFYRTSCGRDNRLEQVWKNVETLPFAMN